MFGANVPLPAQTSDKLSFGQGKVYEQKDGQTNTGDYNRPNGWQLLSAGQHNPPGAPFTNMI